MNRPVSRPRSATPLLAAGFLLLALVVAMPIVFAVLSAQNYTRVQKALVAQDRLGDLVSVMRQGENGSRGYLIGASPISLHTYNMARAQAPLDLQKLDTVLAGPEYAAQLAQIDQLSQDKLAELDKTMALLREGNRAAATAEIIADLNRLTMVDLRNLTVQMIKVQAARVAAGREREMRDAWALELATAFAVFGAVFFALGVINTHRDQTARLLAAEAALIAANDALERKVAERTATLHVSEARFRLLAESLPCIVHMSDAEGKTLYVNPPTTGYSGLSLEACLGFGWAMMLHPQDRNPGLERWRESMETDRNFETEFRLRRHDGVYRWHLGRAVPLRGADGQITGWVGTTTDIHDRKLAETAMADTNASLEQEVSERAAELSRIYEISSDILTVGDFERGFTSVSPAWESITGHPVEAALARPYTDFLHPEDAERTEAAFSKLISGQPISIENRYRRADGSYCWLSWRAVSQPEERLIYCVARDITAEREREEQLRQSQKMEVIGQLTGGVAHDFNNLLTIIMGSLELLARGMAGGEAKFTRRVDAAMEGARRAAALTHRLLAFSRRQPLEPKPLEINRLLAGMSDMLHRTLGETIDVELVSGAGLWQALADANQLENAILNLAVNARDAMPGGGHLSIETQNTYLDENYAAARADVDAGQYVMIAVTDTGTGMSPEVQAKVFEPFFTTKPQGQGTGLGLAQVYGFIKQSGGHISLYTEPGEGTTIKLYLPRVRGAALPEARSTQSAARGLSPAQGQTVLVVEDEAGVRNFSAEVLEELGYKVLTAATAAQALALFEAAAEIRLLFTDVVLAGGMNGRQLADEILRRNPEVTVLFTTGYTRNAIIHHGRLDDGVNFIGKPFTASALGEKVARLFEASAERVS